MQSLDDFEAEAAELGRQLALLPASQRPERMEAWLNTLPPKRRRLASTLAALQVTSLAKDLHMSDRIPKWVLYTSACAFLLLLVGVAVFIPNPTAFQVGVFRTVLALAGIPWGAAIPGFLKVEREEMSPGSKLAIRATGGFALFLLLYFCSPVAFFA